MTDDELVEFNESMDEQADQLREDLPENLGGEPEDYRRYPVADDGE